MLSRLPERSLCNLSICNFFLPNLKMNFGSDCLPFTLNCLYDLRFSRPEIKVCPKSQSCIYIFHVVKYSFS